MRSMILVTAANGNQGKQLIPRLIAQGASIDSFGYWEPMFFEAMRTVHFGDHF